MNVDEILEAATADFFWVPSHVETVERPELTYSYSERKPSLEYNRVVRARPSHETAEALVAEVRQVHGGQPSRWYVNLLSDTPEMRAALRDEGYEARHRYFAHAIRPADYNRERPGEVDVREVESIDDLRMLWSIWGDVFERAPDLSEQEALDELDACTGEGRRVARFVAYRNGDPAGTGGMTFFDELSFALVWAGGVRLDHRGHGVYTALLAARAAVARRRGLDLMGLYAREETSAPIVAAHGFDRHGLMVQFDRR